VRALAQDPSERRADQNTEKCGVTSAIGSQNQWAILGSNQ
jgi:hypothetical protein